MNEQFEERYTSWLEQHDLEIHKFVALASYLSKRGYARASSRAYRLVGRAIASAADGNFVDADVCLVRLWTMYEAIFVNEEPE